MSEEWGPWIDHDGKGCPCVGQYVQIELNKDAEICPTDKMQINERTFEFIATTKDAYMAEWHWDWGPIVIRYRIRKPKGLTILEGILENLPTKEEIDA